VFQENPVLNKPGVTITNPLYDLLAFLQIQAIFFYAFEFRIRIVDILNKIVEQTKVLKL